jgi:hypothetical protein
MQTHQKYLKYGILATVSSSQNRGIGLLLNITSKTQHRA